MSVPTTSFLPNGYLPADENGVCPCWTCSECVGRTPSPDCEWGHQRRTWSTSTGRVEWREGYLPLNATKQAKLL